MWWQGAESCASGVETVGVPTYVPWFLFRERSYATVPLASSKS